MIDKSANLRTRSRPHALINCHVSCHVRTHSPIAPRQQHPPNHILKTVGLLLWQREARIFPVASIVILLLLLLLLLVC